MHHREPVWRSSRRLLRSQVPTGWWEWLLDPASLTQRLQRACDGCFSVEVLSQGWDKPLHNEARAMGLLESRRALIREVYLHWDGKPWVFARTVFPASSLRGRARRLTLLGDRPLGAVLFADPSTKRRRMEAARFDARHALFHDACGHWQQPPAELWRRRKLFCYQGKPLLVNEIFLPDIPAFPL